MKHLAILLMITIAVKLLPAQQPEADDINKSLEVVIRNLPTGLGELKGALINKRGQTSRYHATLTLPGAIETVITEQASFGRKAISWRCTMFRSADLDAAEKKYEELFNQLNNSIIRSSTDKPFIVSGKYKSPASRETTVSRFQLLPSTGEMKHVHIDLILEEQNNLYSLSVHVHQ